MKKLVYAAMIGLVGLAHPVAPGAASEKLPERTGDFISYCALNSENFKRCENDIVNTELAANMGVLGITKRICDPATLGSDALAHAVLDWLAAHPETHDKPRFTMTIDALVSLYPCPN